MSKRLRLRLARVGRDRALLFKMDQKNVSMLRDQVDPS